MAVFAAAMAELTEHANADGTIRWRSTARGLVSDGMDRVRNVEILRFSDVEVSLIKPVVDLHAFDATVAANGQYADTFNNSTPK